MNSKENDELSPDIIALMVVAVVIYFWGVYFHLKIVEVSKKDKDITWKLDVANSIMIILIYSRSITMHCITYIIRDLYKYTGQWFCYVFKVLGIYSTFYLYGHALIISLTKYAANLQFKHLYIKVQSNKRFNVSRYILNICTAFQFRVLSLINQNSFVI